MSTGLEERLLESLSGLMPTGYAWPRSPGSVQMGVLRGLAASLADDLRSIDAAVMRSFPTHPDRLDEWEASCGLPAVWSDPAASDQQRVAGVMSKLCGPVLPYDDSSPAAPAVIEAECARLGYTVRVRYNRPARYGQARFSASYGGLDGVLWVIVNGISRTPARYGLARFSERYTPAIDRLRYLDDIVPARFEIRLAAP